MTFLSAVVLNRDLAVTGLLDLSHGAISGTGNLILTLTDSKSRWDFVTISGAGSVRLLSGKLRIEGKPEAAIDVFEFGSWDAPTLAGNRTLEVSSGSTLEWSQDSFALRDNARIVNRGEFVVRSYGAIVRRGTGQASIENYGDVVYLGGVLEGPEVDKGISSRIDVALNNHQDGRILVKKADFGTSLRLRAGGVFEGSIFVDNGGVLDLEALDKNVWSPFTWKESCRIEGQGDIKLLGGGVVIPSDNKLCTVAPAFILGANGRIENYGGELRFPYKFCWWSGTIAGGVTDIAGKTNIGISPTVSATPDGTPRLLGGVLKNTGTATLWNNTTLVLGAWPLSNKASILNEASGIFSISDDSKILWDRSGVEGEDARITNRGRFQKTVGRGSSVITVPFYNGPGDLVVRGGKVSFSQLEQPEAGGTVLGGRNH
jgi:hypothetical protein